LATTFLRNFSHSDHRYFSIIPHNFQVSNIFEQVVADSMAEIPLRLWLLWQKFLKVVAMAEHSALTPKIQR
jgi:hypothetical protein